VHAPFASSITRRGLLDAKRKDYLVPGSFPLPAQDVHILLAMQQKMR
jgi:hypothetical protein